MHDLPEYKVSALIYIYICICIYMCAFIYVEALDARLAGVQGERLYICVPMYLPMYDGTTPLDRHGGP